MLKNTRGEEMVIGPGCIIKCSMSERTISIIDGENSRALMVWRNADRKMRVDCKNKNSFCSLALVIANTHGLTIRKEVALCNSDTISWRLVE